MTVQNAQHNSDHKAAVAPSNLATIAAQAALASLRRDFFGNTHQAQENTSKEPRQETLSTLESLDNIYTRAIINTNNPDYLILDIIAHKNHASRYTPLIMPYIEALEHHTSIRYGSVMNFLTHENLPLNQARFYHTIFRWTPPIAVRTVESLLRTAKPTEEKSAPQSAWRKFIRILNPFYVPKALYRLTLSTLRNYIHRKAGDEFMNVVDNGVRIGTEQKNLWDLFEDAQLATGDSPNRIQLALKYVQRNHQAIHNALHHIGDTYGDLHRTNKLEDTSINADLVNALKIRHDE